MSRHYEVVSAAEAPLDIVITEQEAYEADLEELEPHEQALVIGNPWDGACAVFGTAQELREFVRDLADLVTEMGTDLPIRQTES